MNILNLFRRHEPEIPVSSSLAERYEVILSGAGGQGAILAGKILAEAASIYDNKEAVMSQSYGPEARGGASRAEVIISSSVIDYPKVMRADILLVMTQQALDKYGMMLKENGLLVVNETVVKSIPDNFKNVFKAPFNSLAAEVLELPIASNLIALGSLVAITKIVPREALIRACLDRVPQKFLVPDRIALDVGYKVVKDSSFKWERLNPKK